MDNITEPVKPAMTDAECEAMIAEYIARKLAPVQSRVNAYCKIEAALVCIPEYPPRFEFMIYTEATGSTNAPRADLAAEFTLAALGDVRTAKRLRAEAAERIARAEQIEAAQAESEVAK